MGNNAVKALGIKPNAEVGTKMFDQLWDQYPSDELGSKITWPNVRHLKMNKYQY